MVSIVMAVGSLVDGRSFVRTWRFSRADFSAQALTFAVTLLVDLVSGLAVGVLASLTLLALGIFGPGIATGLVSGAPQLGAGAMAGAAIGAAGAAVAVGAAATGVGGAVMAGARMAPAAAKLAGAGARAATSAAKRRAHGSS